MGNEQHFTPQAERRWSALGGVIQTRLLNDVWCGDCHKTTTIVNFSGKIERGDLVLEGHCINCNGSVARVIEGA